MPARACLQERAQNTRDGLPLALAHRSLAYGNVCDPQNARSFGRADIYERGLSCFPWLHSHISGWLYQEHLGWNPVGLFQEAPKVQQQSQLGSLRVLWVWVNNTQQLVQENAILIIMIFILRISFMKMAHRPVEWWALAFHSERKQDVLLRLPDHTVLLIYYRKHQRMKMASETVHITLYTCFAKHIKAWKYASSWFNASYPIHFSFS